MAFSLERESRVEFSVRDIAGRLVQRVVLGSLPAGNHHAAWDARDRDGGRLRTGMYFVELKVEERSLGVKRLAVVQ